MQQAMGLAIGLAAAPWAEIITPTAAAAQPLWLRNGFGYATAVATQLFKSLAILAGLLLVIHCYSA